MRPSDATWQYKSGSTLAQVMVFCLTAPSHCLNHCWLLISEILWLEPKRNFTEKHRAIICTMNLTIMIIIVLPYFSGSNALYHGPLGNMGGRFGGQCYFNSLAPGKFKWNFRYVSFKQFLVTNGWGISCQTALIMMSLDFTDDQSTLVQVMAWWRQETSHYPSQCLPRLVAIWCH